MIKKIKALIRENRENQHKIIELNQELDWANVYHDSIRGKVYLENCLLTLEGRQGITLFLCIK